MSTTPTLPSDTQVSECSACVCSKPSRACTVRRIGIGAAVLVVAGVMIWQGVTAHGNPDPMADGISPAAAVMNTAVLVFREGLEAVLVLAALTASLIRSDKGYWKPVALGAGLSFAASIGTWFALCALISSINAPALHIQAATGLLAVVVLLVIMNWFFHNVYWAGWITLHNRRKRSLTETPGLTRLSILRGLAILGFTSVYREGFEVALFLQSVRLRAGNDVVYQGACIGLGLTLLVAMLTFVAHARLPYKRMLVLTGVMLAVVLVVMVGESAQELQQAHWITTTPIPIPLPDWVGTWFAVFPNVETIAGQSLAALLVVGSYFLAKRGVGRAIPVARSAGAIGAHAARHVRPAAGDSQGAVGESSALEPMAQ